MAQEGALHASHLATLLCQKHISAAVPTAGPLARPRGRAARLSNLLSDILLWYDPTWVAYIVVGKIFFLTYLQIMGKKLFSGKVYQGYSTQRLRSARNCNMHNRNLVKPGNVSQIFTTRYTKVNQSISILQRFGRRSENRLK